MSRESQRITRRRFTESLGLAAAGTLVAMSNSAAQTAPATAPATAPTTAPLLDPRIEQIEQSRGLPLADDLREMLARAIAGNDSAGERARQQFTVPDQTEPAVVFTPVFHQPQERPRG